LLAFEGRFRCPFLDEHERIDPNIPRVKPAAKAAIHTYGSR
jgi:hypothetical protein